MIRRLLFLVLACFALGASCRTNITEQTGNADSLQDFENRLETIRQQLGVPGMAAAIVKDGRIAWTKGFGSRDLATFDAVSASTNFHIASLTKTFAGVLLAKLVEQGTLSLDEKISKFGVVIEGDPGITVRHLATMTSEGTPGQAFRYNGDRFGLLQQIIQQSVTRGFADLLVHDILQPLGMTRTAPNPNFAPAFAVSGLNKTAFEANMARGYMLQNGTPQPVAYPDYFGVSAGLVSTVEDMAAFSIAIDSNRIMNAAARKLMFTPAVSVRRDTLPYALGWFVQRVAGVEMQWAYGYWIGNSALIIRVPSRALAFIAMANSDGLSATTQLGAARLISSPFAREFISTFVGSR